MKKAENIVYFFRIGILSRSAMSRGDDGDDDVVPLCTQDRPEKIMRSANIFSCPCFARSEEAGCSTINVDSARTDGIQGSTGALLVTVHANEDVRRLLTE